MKSRQMVPRPFLHVVHNVEKEQKEVKTCSYKDVYVHK